MQNRSKPLISAVIVAALVGPLLGLTAARAWQRSDDHRVLRRFEQEVAQAARAVESQVEGGRHSVVAAAALLSTGEGTTSSEFTRFTLQLMARESVLQALSWAPLVPLAERGRYEADARTAAGAGVRITELSGAGVLVPAARRDRYFPVRFIDPLPGNEAALGFDLASDPVRLSMLTRAAESGRPTVSGLIRLVQDARGSEGFLLAVPVFTPTKDERGARLLSGFATGVFRVEDLLSRAYPSRGAGESQGMVLELLDHDGRMSGGAPAVGLAGGSGQRPTQTIVRHELHLGDRSWTLIARATPAYLAREAHGRAWAIGFGAFLGYELLLALVLTAQRWSRERARRTQAELAQSVIASVSEGVLVADTSSRMIAVNQAARRVLGRGRAVLPPSEWSRVFGLFDPGSGEHVATENLPLVRALRGEEVPATEVYVRNDLVPDGLWASVTGSPLKDSDGRLIGGVVVFRDVTEQKRAVDLAQRLYSAVEQAADSVFITDRRGVIEYVNPAFEATTGYLRSEAIGQTPRLLKSGLQSPDYYATLWATIAGGQPFKGTVLNRKKSGEHFYAEQTITPMRDRSSGEITHFVSVLRDTTEQIRLERSELEMRLGSSVQQKLFPRSHPALPGYDIAGAVAPASATCGDYYDFIALPDGRLALAIADVSGHGVGSALIMTAMRAYLRSLTRVFASPDRLADELNRLLFADLEEDRFVTMILGVLDGTAGTLDWINLGHPAGYVLDRSGAVKAELRSTSRPLGLFPDLTCATGPLVALDPGETLVLLTDGVLEAGSPDGREFGRDAALAVLRSAHDRSADEMATQLVAAVLAHTEGQPRVDDVTTVVCKRGPAR